MQRFAELYQQLDASNKTGDKLAALQSYLHQASPRDGAWAVYFLLGKKLKRAVTSSELRQQVQALTGIPDWLFAECYAAAGDLAETLARLLPATPAAHSPTATLPTLADWIEERIPLLREASAAARGPLLAKYWQHLTTVQTLVWNKLLTGGLRVGVSEGLVIKALAAVASVDPAVMAHRLMGDWQPTAAFYTQLLSQSLQPHEGKPYPFQLAHALQEPLSQLGPPADWALEWKWDGIRAQLLRRKGTSLLWSRGEEAIHAAFPELVTAADSLNLDCVLDGELLAWRGEAPLPFGILQQRLGRKRADAKLQKQVPVIFLAFDLLELAGQDLRTAPLTERRKKLTEVLQGANISRRLKLAPTITLNSWEDADAARQAARQHAAEGIMLKRWTSTYGAGRVRGDWWKWKLQPYTVDAVLIYAQVGHGARAGLFTDYTFAVWDQQQLVPFAKAYSGLDKTEIKELDGLIRKHTQDKFGPVRTVEPQWVFELAFEGIAKSTRHKSGVAVRFPRILRWRKDKLPADADHLQTLLELIPAGSSATDLADTLPESGERQLLLFD